LVEGTPRSLFFIDEIELILANLFEAELLGGFAEEAAEFIDVVGVGIDGAWREISQLHVLDHTGDVGIESSVVGCHGWWFLEPGVWRSETHAGLR